MIWWIMLVLAIIVLIINTVMSVRDDYYKDYLKRKR